MCTGFQCNYLELWTINIASKTLSQSFIITVKGQKILVGKKAAHAQTLNFM